jgi:Zn-finger nucleic acid-binding protein
MRNLVACPHCHRQYDASALAIGKQFRCHCGTVLTVHAPQGHDAAVVCCAHCGAPRSEGATNCAYCGAEFTLHERDLDTVCPHCFARVSHNARFCHFCGKAIHPEMVAGQASKLNCPACGEGHILTSRAWGDVSALECQRCAGLWLSGESFRHLTEQAASDGMNVESHERPLTARLAETEQPLESKFHYRPCPVCGEMMNRQNFGGRSGVVIDVCRSHGVWFDADELSRILDWIRSGGLARANEARADKLSGSETIVLQSPAVTIESSDLTSSESFLRGALEAMKSWHRRI